MPALVLGAHLILEKLAPCSGVSLFKFNPRFFNVGHETISKLNKSNICIAGVGVDVNKIWLLRI